MQLGYEARCATPHAFDVVLGCQLRQGAWRALEEEDADAYMVSMIGQMKRELHNFHPPLDIVDGAARINDPIFDRHQYGQPRVGPVPERLQAHGLVGHTEAHAARLSTTFDLSPSLLPRALAPSPFGSSLGSAFSP